MIASELGIPFFPLSFDMFFHLLPIDLLCLDGFEGKILVSYS